jgi:hypothetical protein
MAMVCTRCSTSHEQALHCPTCGNALTYVEPRKRGKSYRDLARGWQHTDFGRFLIGLGLAQGLFYGLHHLVKSVFVAVNGQPLDPASMPLTELVCVQSLQLFGLLVGCVTAGVARPRAVVLGVYIAVANSILSLILRQWPAYALGTFWVYGQPFIQIVVGSFGALLSSLVWKPLTAATLPETPSRMARKLGAKRPPIMKLFAGQLSWFRVALGTLLATAGCLAAQPALKHVLNNSDLLSLDEYMQEVFLMWELKCVALLLGGMLAGYGTANGLKQGLAAGIATGMVMTMALGYRHASLEMVGLSVVLAFMLAVVGGWFGGQLFPPVVARKRLKGMGPATM